MENKKLLIVEDNVAEAIYAQGDAIKAGFKDLVVATNLAEALEYLPKAQLVASDLFFPAGNIPAEQMQKYIQRFLPLYSAYKERSCMTDLKNNPTRKAIEKCAEVFGVTPQEYLDNYMTKMNNPKILMDMARQAMSGIRDPVRYEKLTKIENDLRKGIGLPLGIIVTEQAREKGLANVIVTSTNHHDMAFEPVSNLLGTRYFDSLVDGRKNWKAGIEYLAGGQR